MPRSFRAQALLGGIAIVVASSVAAAQSRVAFLADQLKNGADFRVRTQAALALGSSDEFEALSPLCDGLEDSNETVRSASAAGIGKLGKKEGLECLKKHASESNASVKSVIARSIATLAGPSGGAGTGAGKPPAPTSSDKGYVAIGPTTDKTGRTGTELADIVRATMQAKLVASGYAVAPDKESAAAARAVLGKAKLKGYMLQTAVDAPKYDGGSLTVQVRVTMWSYPGKALQGEFSPKLTVSGGKAGDTSGENDLIKMALERAVDSFAQVAATTD